MSLNSAVHDEVAYRNAANRSSLFLLRLSEFPRFAVHTPEGVKRIADSQGGGEYFWGRGPELVSGEESANPVGREVFQSRACVRGAAAGFQLDVTANRNSLGGKGMIIQAATQPSRGTQLHVLMGCAPKTRSAK